MESAAHCFYVPEHEVMEVLATSALCIRVLAMHHQEINSAAYNFTIRPWFGESRLPFLECVQGAQALATEKPLQLRPIRLEDV